ncbi:hypothetical protein [Paenibacillus sp. Y412MC10]|nr:hypothetical protein [Paenibacillus sp. Y412MC10]
MTKGRLFMAEKKSAASQAPPMIDGPYAPADCRLAAVFSFCGANAS